MENKNENIQVTYYNIYTKQVRANKLGEKLFYN